jgi:hypothetical protein
MAVNTYIILGFVSILLIGFLNLFSNLKLLVRRLEFLSEYRNKFIQLSNFYFSSHYAAARTYEPELYTWLTLNSNKAQRDIGSFGVGAFIAPFQSYKITNYQFIINSLPKFRDGHIHQNEVTTVDQALLRCIGYLREIEEGLRRDIRNPVKWFQFGVKYILSLPARFLNWFGIINDNAVDKIIANGFFKLGSGIISLIAFASSIVSLFSGWEIFSKIIAEFFKSTIK